MRAPPSFAWIAAATLGALGCAPLVGPEAPLSLAAVPHDPTPPPLRPTPARDAPAVRRQEAFEWLAERTGRPSQDPSELRQLTPFPGLLYLDTRDWKTPEKLDRGYVLILPGIEGRSPFNFSIGRGLADAEHEEALEVYDWTTGHWPLMLYHLAAWERNREQARRVAAKIVAYQDQHPGRPVRLIGHSGGAAMCVLTLEALPADRKVEQVILLAAALAPEHDLAPALAKTRSGLWNFTSRGDWVTLGIGTSLAGTLDRKHAVSAGAIGFHAPPAGDPRGALYAEKLHEVPFELKMFASLNFGGHDGPVQRRFVRDYVAPLVRRTRPAQASATGSE